MTSSPTMDSFSDLALPAPIMAAIKDIGYETPSPIQAKSIPVLLAGKDLVGQAQTGTGKTGAFALPLLSRLELGIKEPQVLVLAPTRELAIQVAEAFQVYARHMKGFHILPIYGGQSMDIQLRQLRRGVHVVVGTPGRIMDHLRRKTLKLDNLKALVLDEADEMLKMGFIDDVEWILEQTPAERQIALFSATMPDAIKRIARKHLNAPEEIKIKSQTSTATSITQRYWQVTGTHKLDALTRILEVEAFDAMIIFVRTKTATVDLTERLEARGYACAALNGDINQAIREKTVARLKNKSLDIIVATDVAARGLDVERISHVLNFDIPHDTDSYVHRIGRTGRAGRKGDAILFVSPREKRMLRSIEKATKQPITEMQLPSHEAVKDRRITQFKDKITTAIESQELGFFENVVEQYQQEHNISLSEIAAALVYMNQVDRPLNVKKSTRERPLGAKDNHERKSSDRPARRDGKNKDRHESKRDKKHDSDRKPRRKKSDDDLLLYRIQVGKSHGAEARNIIGAIANEAGLDNQHIGALRIHDTYSTIELPDGMPKDVFNDLKKTRVCNQKLDISLEANTRESSAKGSSDRESGNTEKNPKKKISTKESSHKGSKKTSNASNAKKRVGSNSGSSSGGKSRTAKNDR